MRLRPGAAIFLVSVAILIGYAVAPAPADALVIQLNHEFSGATQPCGTGPWLTATFADQAFGVVRLTMTGNLGQAGCTNERLKEWLFNLDPALDPTNLSFTHVSGKVAFAPPPPGTPAIQTGVNAFMADGDGNFDIKFNWAQAAPPCTASNVNCFGNGDTSVYDITYSGVGTFNKDSFDFLSAEAGGRGTFRSAAHVVGIGLDGARSGWIGDKNGNGTTEEVPEPSTALLLGTALLGVIGVGRRIVPKS